MLLLGRLDSIENYLLKRWPAIEESVENAHCRISDIVHQISSLQCQLKEMQTTRKNGNIMYSRVLLKTVRRSLSWTTAERQHRKRGVWSSSLKVFDWRVACSPT